MNKVTYVIPIWDKTLENEIVLSLNSLISESKYIDQIIIVHDGRKSFFLKISRLPKSLEKKILHVYTWKNNGPGIARNYGCVFSKTNFIFFLDSGDESYPKRIEKQLPLVLKNGYAYGHIKEINYNGSKVIKKSVVDYKKALKMLPFRPPFCNVSLAIKKNIFLDLYGFPPLRLAEDWVLMAKLLKKFLLVSVVDDTLVKVNLGKDFINRRRGINKILEIVKALLYIKKINLVPLYKLVISSIIQICSRLLPSFVLNKIYLILRS